MKPQIDRRRFIQTSGRFLAAAAAAPALLAQTSTTFAEQSGSRYKKAVGWGMIEGDLSIEDKLKLAKDVGFEGVEISSGFLRKNGQDPKDLARASEKTGVAVHGLVGSAPDLTSAIDEAAIYGATSVLHVARPDPKGSFMTNYKSTQDLIRQAIPNAEKKRIYILIENVWNTFLIEPLTMARYIDELNSPYVKAYFDIGNVVRWGWPQHWIEVLGKRVVKIHIKEYDLNVAMKEGMGKGFNCPIGKGSIEWDRVCAELKKIDFHGWATAEVGGGDRKRLTEISQQMDHVLSL